MEKALTWEQIMEGFSRIEKLHEEAAIRAAEEEKRAVEKAAVEEVLRQNREKEAEKRIKELEVLIGNVNNNRGFEAEEYFQTALAKTLDFAGIKFDKMYPNWKITGKKGDCEFDIVLVNGNSAAIIEVKNRIHPSFVEEIATKKLAQFRKYFKEIKNPKIYLGVAGFSFDKSVVEEAKKYGVAILKQSGDSIVVNTDDMKVY